MKAKITIEFETINLSNYPFYENAKDINKYIKLLINEENKLFEIVDFSTQKIIKVEKIND